MTWRDQGLVQRQGFWRQQGSWPKRKSLHRPVSLFLLFLLSSPLSRKIKIPRVYSMLIAHGDMPSQSIPRNNWSRSLYAMSLPKRSWNSCDHFLFRCSLWSEHRSEIRQLAGCRWGDTSYLLGGSSGPSKDGLFERWKPNAEMINTTIQFAVNTTRLNDKRGGDETSPDPTPNPSSLD